MVTNSQIIYCKSMLPVCHVSDCRMLLCNFTSFQYRVDCMLMCLDSTQARLKYIMHDVHGLGTIM